MEDVKASIVHATAYLYRAGARHEVLHGIQTGKDAADPDNGDLHLSIDLVHAANAQRLDRRTA